MKKFDYDQAQKRIELATAVLELAIAISGFASVVHSLLSMAFNYFEHSYNAKLSQVVK